MNREPGFVYIYALTGERGEILYVGKSIEPKTRWVAHCAASGPATKKNQWIRELKARGVKPGLLILEKVSDTAWKEAERRWIAACKTQGSELFNLTEGGEVGWLEGKLWDGFIDPSGCEIPAFHNLILFCHERGLSAQSMMQLHSGVARSYHGWTCERPGMRSRDKVSEAEKMASRQWALLVTLFGSDAKRAFDRMQDIDRNREAAKRAAKEPPP